MAYDTTRCPQTESEAADYYFAVIQRTVNTPANDWQAVMLNSNLPHNIYTPGMKADASWPMFGFTQMWSGGPRGRIFLPAVAADENNYWTRQIQVIADDGKGGLVWAWQRISGHDYAPVQGAAAGGGGGPIVIQPGGGLSKDEVQAMIDASIQTALHGTLQYGAKVALRTNSGFLAGIAGGGPTVENAAIEWIGKDGAPHAWESFELVKGE